MRDIAELRQAMAAETADLTPQTSVEDLLRGGRRRNRRRVVAVTAAAAAVLMAAPVGLWAAGRGGGDPMVGSLPVEPSPDITVERVSPLDGPHSVPPHLRTPSELTDPFDRGCPPGDAKTATAIGDTIWTGTTNSKGEDLLVRFIEKDPGDTSVASIAVGLGDSASGRVDDLGCMFGFSLPPDPDAYPGHHGAEYDGPGFGGPNSNTTIIGTFVGPADRITASYDGKPLTVEFARWSAHPQLVVYWITGVPANADVNPRDDTHPLVTIYDATGKVIGPAR